VHADSLSGRPIRSSALALLLTDIDVNKSPSVLVASRGRFSNCLIIGGLLQRKEALSRASHSGLQYLEVRV
jgi:hypothetical protein